MSKIVKKSFSNPDVKPDFPKVDARTLEMGDGVKVSRVVAEHGWKWSECVKPTIGTDSCQASHIGVLAKGNMTVRMDDGTEINYEAGDAYMIGPGPVSYTHLRAHETLMNLVCRLLLEKKK